MDEERLLVTHRLADEVISIPDSIAESTGSESASGAVLLSCSDWCSEACGTSSELSCTCSNQGGETPCVCSNQGGQCTCSNQGGQCTCSNQGGQTPSKTPLPAGRITSTSSTDTTITIRFTSISGAVGYQVAIRKESVSGATEYKIGNRTSYTFGGLTPDTTYVVNYCGIDSDGDRGYYITSSVTRVTTLPARPKYWSWTDGLVSSKPAVGALSTGDDIPEYLSASGWTSFVQNIKDVYRYLNGTSYSGSLSNGGNGTTVLSAAMVNQAITAIGTMTSTYLPGRTTSGTTKLSASLLNGLADSLNSITYTQ